MPGDLNNGHLELYFCLLAGLVAARCVGAPFVWLLDDRPDLSHIVARKLNKYGGLGTPVQCFSLFCGGNYCSTRFFFRTAGAKRFFFCMRHLANKLSHRLVRVAVLYATPICPKCRALFTRRTLHKQRDTRHHIR